MLSDLERRFTQFRREYPRGARVPEDLRAATLIAQVKGVSASAIHRACGVSWSQLMAWKGERGSAGTQRAKSKADVRVFSVVDDPIDRGAPRVSPDHELELRLGAWSISVRLSDPIARERR